MVNTTTIITSKPKKQALKKIQPDFPPLFTLKRIIFNLNFTPLNQPSFNAFMKKKCKHFLLFLYNLKKIINHRRRCASTSSSSSSLHFKRPSTSYEKNKAFPPILKIQKSKALFYLRHFHSSAPLLLSVLLLHCFFGNMNCISQKPFGNKGQRIFCCILFPFFPNRYIFYSYLMPCQMLAKVGIENIIYYYYLDLKSKYPELAHACSWHKNSLFIKKCSSSFLLKIL